MPTAQLKASFLLLILFLAISMGAKALGALQPPNPALRGFTEGCQDKLQPCWYGILPGEIFTPEVAAIIKERGDVPCNITVIQEGYSGRILSIELQRCNGIAAGDLVVNFSGSIPNGIYAPITMILDLSSPWFMPVEHFTMIKPP